MVTRKEYMKWQKQHPNFMTPNVEKVAIKGNTIIELSSGSGFLGNNKLYGVSVLHKTPAGFKTDNKKGKPFHNRRNAEKYFKKLKKVV